MWLDQAKTPMVITRGINHAIQEDAKFSNHVITSVQKYYRQNWGDTHKDDWKLNDSAVENEDDRIVALYKHDDYDDIFIITEYDRSATTILFAHEY